MPGEMYYYDWNFTRNAFWTITFWIIFFTGKMAVLEFRILDRNRRD